MAVQVDVAQGTLQGKLCSYKGKTYYSFEGIPYAKPPVGKLRFREPQEPQCWLGVRDATKPGNKCMQINPATMKDLIGSEDCLFLNVYTPNLPNEQLKKLPVVFYVHGGKLIFGYGDYYRPDYFIEQDVILVTINYRLHVLGFLCLNEAEAAGNMGLKDTVMAFNWVKNNIDKFNGDRNNIIVFGESAGAAVVTSYLTSNMVNGFSKVIGMSGVCVSDLYMIEEDPIFKAKHLAAVLGKEFSDVKSLQEFLVNVPIEQLLFAVGVVEASRPPSIINAYFLPVVEKKFEGLQSFFEEHPIVTFRENRYKKVPVLFGVNSHEGAFFAQKDKKGNVIFENDLRYFVPRFLSLKAHSPEVMKLADNMRNFYFNGAVIDETKKLEYINFVSDAYFNRDIVTFLDCFGEFHDELYLFRLSYSSDMNTRIMKKLGLKGTTHGDLLQYVFYKKRKDDSANEKDREILTILNETVCNFAKTGIPAWSRQTIKWEPYSPTKRSFVDIDEEPKLLQNFNDKNPKFWSSMGERSKL
uniref:Carboxylesterase n=1 Tax=Epiphyas postvittana TaxID=65032 RepID=A0A0K8TV77_EPIPO